MIMSYPRAAAQPLPHEFPVYEFLYWFAAGGLDNTHIQQGEEILLIFIFSCLYIYFSLWWIL